MRAALWFPQQCMIDLQHRIRNNGLFRADHCNLVESCWVRESGQKTYTFTFYPAYVGFSFEER